MRTLLSLGLSFLVLAIFSSVWVSAEIQVNSSYHIGDEITIHGATNFNTDNSVLIEIWPAEFGPRSKYEPHMNGGGSLVVPIYAVNNAQYGWNGTFNTSGWAQGMYFIRVEVIGKQHAETVVIDLAADEQNNVAPEIKHQV
jgi:hypothetical protein